MAVKKSSAPKVAKKAAPKKAAPKKAAPKKAAPKKAAPKSTAKVAPKATAKKAAAKKPAVKLTDPQAKLLVVVASKGEAGHPGNKSEAKTLGILLEKKLVKKGKKEGAFFKYHITKVGHKHVGHGSTSSEPTPSPSA